MSDISQLLEYPKVPVCRVGREEGGTWHVAPGVLAVDMPADYGRLLPSTGEEGVAYWKRVGPLIL